MHGFVCSYFTLVVVFKSTQFLVYNAFYNTQYHTPSFYGFLEDI